MRLYSIRTRILGGFAALILLQVAVAATVWQAENRVDTATTADAAVEASNDRIIVVRAALSIVQLRLANFVRTGSATDKDNVTAALGKFDEATTHIEGGSAAQLAAGAEAVRTALKAILTASTARRDELAALVQNAKDAETALAALAQAVPKASDRQAVEAATSIVAEAITPLVATQRFAANGDDIDAQTVLTSSGKIKEALQTLLQNSAALTPRIQRMAANVTTSFDAIGPAMDKFAKALALRATSITKLDAAADQVRTAILEIQNRLSTERQARQQETVTARHAVRVTVLAAAAAAGLIGIGLAFLVGQSITRPITRLAGAMRRIADGALQLEVPDRTRKDEIGGMAGAVQVFKDNMLGANQLAVEQQQAKSNAAAAEKAALNRTADAFEASVGGVVTMVSTCAAELESTARSMSAIAGRTTDQASTAAAAADQASAAVQTVATAAADLTASIHDINRQVQRSSEITGRAVADTGRTNAIVQALAAAA